MGRPYVDIIDAMRTSEVLVSRINEAVDEFIDKNSPSRSLEAKAQPPCGLRRRAATVCTP